MNKTIRQIFDWVKIGGVINSRSPWILLMPFAVGDRVYLSTENLNLPKNRSRKLIPKFIGPYKVTHSYPEESRYTLELPDELKA
jgi:hypothetical protein